MNRDKPANANLKCVSDLYSRPATVEEMDERVPLGLHHWEALVVERQFPAQGRILDLGCGCGREAIALAARGYEVVGADISAAQLERARWNAIRAGLAIRWLLVDGLEVPAAPFEAAVLWAQLLGNMVERPDQLALLRNCLAALRPGGVITASGHYEDYCRRIWGAQTDDNWFYPTGSWQGPAIRYWMFTEETLAELLTEAGFEVLESEVPESLPAIVHVVARRMERKP